MHVRELPLPGDVADHFEGAGIETLYPPQEAAVEAGVCEGDRVVAAIPTASGKTFVAELAMLTADGPALYIVPLRALAREKFEQFSALPGVSVGISTGDFDSAAEELAGHDVVVATSEKVDSAIRNGAPWVDDLACVVVDEVHLLGSRSRGPTLEVTLATLQRRAPGVQVVALSATVENPGEIAEWLDAALVESTWRPVDLRTGVYAGGGVEFDDGTDRSVDIDAGAGAEPGTAGDAEAPTAATVALVRDAVADGGQCLAFVRSRREAEALADRIAATGVDPTPERAGAVADDVAAVDATGTGRRLADCARAGVAFHHAGLRSTHRAVVETAFRNRDLAVICATPTLAAGVNVPARRVVVRDQQRYTGSGMEWLPVLEVHQMCGRAGRPHLDPYGEAVLVGAETGREELWERYVEGEPEAVESKLADPSALRTHVLSVVASGFAESRPEVRDLLDATFYAHQTGPDAALSGALEDALAGLSGMGMLERDEGDAAGEALAATPLGRQVSRQYLTPESGARIVEGLRSVETMAAENVTALTALELVCDTPDMHTGYLGDRERAGIYQFARDHAAEFTTAMGEAEDFEGWLKAVKTARILQDWADGASVEEVVESYRIGPGDVESRLERAAWLLGAADALADVVDVELPILGRLADEFR
jgi:helicase